MPILLVLLPSANIFLDVLGGEKAMVTGKLLSQFNFRFFVGGFLVLTDFAVELGARELTVCVYNLI